MPFPVGASTITVTGTFAGPVAGSARAGQVWFTPTSVLVDSTQHAIYSGGGPAELNESGQLSAQLLCNDDTDILPEGWRWRVDEQPTGGQRRTYYIDLPSTLGPTVDLSTLAPVSAPDGTGESLPPTGPAGGALTGSYPNPSLSAAATASFDAAGAAAAAQSAAATDATNKVATHTSATDPHDDRAYADNSKLAKGSNLSDLASPSTARTNLGLGGAAVLNVGTTSSTVAAGDSLLNLPSDQGLLAWTYDPDMAGHVTAQSSGGVGGRITLTRIILRRQITWSNIWVGISGVDTAATLSNCYLGVYGADGTRLGVTADISSQLVIASNAKAMGFPLATPFTAAPGQYFIAMLLNGSWTTNTFHFKASGAGISVNANLTAPNLRYSNMLTSQTSLPASLNLASQTTITISTGWASQWYGVS